MTIATVEEFQTWASNRGITLTGNLEAALYVAENDFLTRYTFKDGVTDEQKKPALFQAAYQHTLGRLFVDVTEQTASGIIDSESSSVGSLSESISYKSGSARTDTFSTAQIDALLRGLVLNYGLGTVARW